MECHTTYCKTESESQRTVRGNDYITREQITRENLRIWYSMVVKHMHPEASTLSPTFKRFLTSTICHRSCGPQVHICNKMWTITLFPPTLNKGIKQST